MVIIAIVVVSVAGCGIKVVDTGQRGVKTRFGEITSTSLPEGLYFYNPITSNIIEIDTRVQRQDGDTESYTRDVQQAHIKYTLNYRLQQDKAHVVYRDVGRDWEQKLIPQVVLGTLKEVVGKWDAVDLIAGGFAPDVVRERLQIKGPITELYRLLREAGRDDLVAVAELDHQSWKDQAA